MVSLPGDYIRLGWPVKSFSRDGFRDLVPRRHRWSRVIAWELVRGWVAPSRCGGGVVAGRLVRGKVPLSWGSWLGGVG